MSIVARSDEDKGDRRAGVGLVGLSAVLFFRALASGDAIPGLSAGRVWVIRGGQTALSRILAVWVPGRDG